MCNFKAFQPINLQITWVMSRITVKLKNGHWSNNLVLGSCLFRLWTTDLGFWLHWSLTAEDFSCCFGWPSSGSFAYEGPRGRVESGRRLSYEIYESTMEKPCDNWGERFGDRDDLEPSWWFQIFFMFTPTWGWFPIWQIFFKSGETTN